MHAFAGIWSQTIDMSPFTQCGQLRLFLLQVLITHMHVRTLLWTQKVRTHTALSNFGASTILTCEATTKPDVVSAVNLRSSSRAASAVDGASLSPDVPTLSQGQSKRS